MATAKPSIAAPPRRRWRRPVFFLALAGLAGLVWFWQPIMGFARTGAALGARVGCSCHFVAQRPINQCRKDFEPGMGLVMLSADAGAKSVTARFAPFASATAHYHPGEGCVLEPWKSQD